jgi:diketogulonate reductase-like aldo/keto reductase
MKMFKLLLVALSLAFVYGEEIAPRITQNDGSKIPLVGLGTWKTGAHTYQAVRDAIEGGYRHIDTSLGYGTEKDVGRAIKDLITEGKIKREDVYVVSKLEGNNHARARVPVGIKESLANLGLKYLDLYLVHFPSKTTNEDIDTWAGMEDVHKEGLTKSIGVSNFIEQHLDHILAKATVKPVTNQVLCNPYHNQKKLLSYLTKHNITLTAYSPLGGTGEVATLMAETKLVSIAKAHNVTSAQIVLKYQVQRNVIVIPSSTTKTHILEDIDLFNFKLTDAEVQEIDSLSKN